MNMGRGIAGAMTLIGSVALYFLLAGEVSTGEAIACALMLAVVCPYAVAIARVATVPMVVPVRGSLSLLKAVATVPVDLWWVGRTLAGVIVRRPEGMLGSVKHVPFRFGAFERADIGRRGAVGAAMSLAPNGIVLGMDRRADEMLVHQLADRSIGGNPEWPL